jgi:hypothetical protein
MVRRYLAWQIRLVCLVYFVKVSATRPLILFFYLQPHIFFEKQTYNASFFTQKHIFQRIFYQKHL